MTTENQNLIKSAEKAALEVLLHNSKGPFLDLPRTAAWGYPEPYTRDLLISILGIATSKNPALINSMRSVLETLAKNQSYKGQIPSFVHDKNNLGSSDTTPLFLMAVGIFRKVLDDSLFLKDAADKALLWMEYQCPTSHYLIAQQPTSDWRDEQWVPGYGLFVNTLTYTGLKLLGKDKNAKNLGNAINQLTYASDESHTSPHEGLAIKDKPYYALWSYKVYSSDRFDLLGNSLAILSGLAIPSKAKDMVDCIKAASASMQKNKALAPDLTPNFFPFIEPNDADWLPRYSEFNKPGDYHNGGIWPFISGFYIAALVAIKKYDLAEKELLALTKLIKIARNKELEFGFNEWYKAQDGNPMGQDWQTWSASNYLFAAQCVAEKRTPFFDSIQ
ncbi:glycoside hydrolase 100 family protein [Salegentibacter salegens]|uniref:beta-fructofuranosidase n=1 Tax=Salegentibacter salegens TaxID=143223 RepID=A0A1M7L7U4_9FLAO|nr:glycoside hydrolase 100 family protein [Salegentibacter salegens]PRX42185.1 alkaline and neutral invertase-like protein [Salegentibacter salegens]SHM74075.1 Alkaline and neutral invertase [Salegentibacter salegens]